MEYSDSMIDKVALEKEIRARESQRKERGRNYPSLCTPTIEKLEKTGYRWYVFDKTTNATYTNCEVDAVQVVEQLRKHGYFARVLRGNAKNGLYHIAYRKNPHPTHTYFSNNQFAYNVMHYDPFK